MLKVRYRATSISSCIQSIILKYTRERVQTNAAVTPNAIIPNVMLVLRTVEAIAVGESLSIASQSKIEARRGALNSRDLYISLVGSPLSRNPHILSPSSVVLYVSSSLDYAAITAITCKDITAFLCIASPDYVQCIMQSLVGQPCNDRSHWRS